MRISCWLKHAAFENGSRCLRAKHHPDIRDRIKHILAAIDQSLGDLARLEQLLVSEKHLIL